MQSRQQTSDKTSELAPFGGAQWEGHAAQDPGPATQRGTPRHVPHFFSPLKIREVTFKNRAVVSPMYQPPHRTQHTSLCTHLTTHTHTHTPGAPTQRWTAS